MVKCGVLFEVRAELLNIISMGSKVIGGLEVNVLAIGPDVPRSNPTEEIGFLMAIKIHKHVFLRRESKAVGPCRRFTACETTLQYFVGNFCQVSPASPQYASAGVSWQVSYG
jgi:hypothetical protein